jgi:hypothetical protein
MIHYHLFFFPHMTQYPGVGAPSKPRTIHLSPPVLLDVAHISVTVHFFLLTSTAQTYFPVIVAFVWTGQDRHPGSSA